MIYNIYIYTYILLHVLSVARRAACGEGPWHLFYTLIFSFPFLLYGYIAYMYIYRYIMHMLSGDEQTHAHTNTLARACTHTLSVSYMCVCVCVCVFVCVCLCVYKQLSGGGVPVLHGVKDDAKLTKLTHTSSLTNACLTAAVWWGGTSATSSTRMMLSRSSSIQAASVRQHRSKGARIA